LEKSMTIEKNSKSDDPGWGQVMGPGKRWALVILGGHQIFNRQSQCDGIMRQK
jgi:hypothetical protein